MLKIKHISFDLDGTLINSIPVMQQAWSETMFELGLAVGFKEYKRYIGLPFSQIIEKFGMEKIENEIESLYFHKTKKYSNQINVVHGAVDILEWCKKNEITTSIITSKPRVNTQAIISEKKLGTLIVVNKHKKTTGIITDGQIRRISQKFSNFHALKVKEVMTKKPIKINKEILASKALAIMNDNKITSLCVTSSLDKNKTIGIIHIHNILKNDIS